MKTFFRILIFILSIQLCAYPVFAEELSSFYLVAENKNISENDLKKEEPSKPTKDEEFSNRSERASKFFFSDIPRHLGYDLKESFWGWGSLAFGIGIGSTAILHTQDKAIQQSFAPHHLFGYTGDKVINYMGAPYTMAGVSVLTTIIGAGIQNLKLRTAGEALMESLFWTELFTVGLQFAFNRTRPNGSGRGFPSGHTSGAFSTATILHMMYGPKVGAPMYAFATLVALARVDSYYHFPSDVLMGAVLGSVIAYGTARFHKKLYKDFKITPQVGENNYGLSLSHEF